MISNILNNKSVWKVLLLFSYGRGVGYTRGKFKELTKLQNKSLDKVIRILDFYDLIIKKKRIIKLNLRNKFTDEIMNLIEKEKEKLNYPNYNLYLILNEIIRVLETKKKINEIYLFGSHAKKIASKNSDIDIAVITENLNLDLTTEQEKLEEKLNFKIQFHIHKFSNNLLSEEIKLSGIKLI
jgi:predicted nucleotidyltransferase